MAPFRAPRLLDVALTFASATRVWPIAQLEALSGLHGVIQCYSA
jgi:hypothetical protein